MKRTKYKEELEFIRAIKEDAKKEKKLVKKLLNLPKDDWSRLITLAGEAGHKVSRERLKAALPSRFFMIIGWKVPYQSRI